jgi:hypothetical protein
VQEIDASIGIDNLRIPWLLVSLSDGRSLVSEMPGDEKIYGNERKK